MNSEVPQSCPTLWNPVDCSLPGFSVHGILQARILEWVTISLSRGSSRPRDRTQVSRIGGRRFNLWATREAPNYKFILLQMIISKWNCWVAVGCVYVCLHAAYAKLLQSCLILCDPMDCSPPGSSVPGILQAGYWSGLPFPPPGDLLDLGIEPTSLMSSSTGRWVLYH